MDIDSINGRFAYIREKTGLNKKKFADELGVNQSVSGDIELGHREPSREVLVKLATIYNVDINWLLTGIGEPFREKPIEKQKPPLLEELERLIDQKIETRISEIESRLKEINS